MIMHTWPEKNKLSSYTLKNELSMSQIDYWQPLLRPEMNFRKLLSVSLGETELAYLFMLATSFAAIT